jgi:predicted NBD/HSP70 family sugar kinase
VENNLRSMALAELWSGRGRGLRSLVCLGVRSGIGSGIIVDGKLLRGANNGAGEIGQWLYPGLKLDAERTIEDIASLSALLAATDLPAAADLLAALGQNDRRVVAMVAQAARVHGWIVHQLAAVCDPERVIVVGPLVEDASYLAALRQAVTKLGGASLAAVLEPSDLGRFAGAIGAAALAFQQWKPPR